jgi:hypothetical protein
MVEKDKIRRGQDQIVLILTVIKISVNFIKEKKIMIMLILIFSQALYFILI